MGASGRAMLRGAIPRSPAGSPAGIIGPGKQVIAWIGPETSLPVGQAEEKQATLSGEEAANFCFCLFFQPSSKIWSDS